jgi:hypothetical protein
MTKTDAIFSRRDRKGLPGIVWKYRGQRLLVEYRVLVVGEVCVCGVQWWHFGHSEALEGD